MKKKFLITKFLKMLNGLAMCLAVLSVQTTCVWVHHQPKLPEGLKRNE